jgi:hypothetical protein
LLCSLSVAHLCKYGQCRINAHCLQVHLSLNIPFRIWLTINWIIFLHLEMHFCSTETGVNSVKKNWHSYKGNNVTSAFKHAFKVEGINQR